jgi:hypothetical protein
MEGKFERTIAEMCAGVIKDKSIFRTRPSQGRWKSRPPEREKNPSPEYTTAFATSTMVLSVLVLGLTYLVRFTIVHRKMFRI